ncbi:hypothetical protein G7Y89_g13791 [Cudoniella acicularis]|uniref:Wax synthase domain-containing protein n=1 Tax=Cudoniella acicularis TaxID=354080 RepID=A0A8H4R6K0_9HELO|nr:hypothetical protein G7Y89_g13791 [Cudoniella acicularis]
MPEWEPLTSARAAFFTGSVLGIWFYTYCRPQTHPKALLLLSMILNVFAVLYSDALTSDFYLNGLVARGGFIWLAHVLFYHLLYPAELNARKGPRSWKYGMKMLFNSRQIGSPLSTVKIPSLTDYDETFKTTPKLATKAAHIDDAEEEKIKIKKEKEIPVSSVSRKLKFSVLSRRLGILFLRYIALCIYYDKEVNWYLPTGWAPWGLHDVTPTKEIFLRRLLPSLGLTNPSASMPALEARDYLLRFHLTIDQILGDYLMISALHDLFAITFIATCLDTDEEWPPLFGNISDAYTVRGFWGKFWHHLVYRPYSAFAAFISSKILGMKERSSTTRLVNNALVFIISGFVHWFAMMSVPGPICGKWLVGVWYLMNFGAIVAEEFVQRGWGTVESKLPLGRRGRKVMGWIYAEFTKLHPEAAGNDPSAPITSKKLATCNKSFHNCCPVVNWGWQDADWGDTMNNINYLYNVGGTCNVGPRSCVNIACFDVSGIFMCNDLVDKSSIVTITMSLFAKYAKCKTGLGNSELTSET